MSKYLVDGRKCGINTSYYYLTIIQSTYSRAIISKGIRVSIYICLIYTQLNSFLLP